MKRVKIYNQIESDLFYLSAISNYKIKRSTRNMLYDFKRILAYSVHINVSWS